MAPSLAGHGCGYFALGQKLSVALAATTSYLELDAADLRAEDRPLLGLLGPDALEPGGLFDRLVTESKRFGAELRDPAG